MSERRFTSRYWLQNDMLCHVSNEELDLLESVYAELVLLSQRFDDSEDD